MRHEIDVQSHAPFGDVMSEAISKCVHCGFCLSACPTYQELQQETDSPRGRIILMKEVLEGGMPLETASPHLDACLGCVACVPACPSEVAYGDLLSSFRATQESKRARPWTQRLRRWLTQATLPYPKRFRIAARTGRFVKPFRRAVPASLRVMMDLLPDKIPKQTRLPSVVPAIGEKRGSVALLTGCAQSVLDPDINVATIEVLTRNGFEVQIPRSQGCCGALSWHIGNHDQAKKFAIDNLDAFETTPDVDAVITNAAGCGSGMLEYPLILKGTRSETKARSLAEKVIDVSHFLAQRGLSESLPETPSSIKVAYQDACHLAHAQGVRQSPRELLTRIPGIELVELRDSHLCCGSAGTYNMDQPEIAASLGGQKVDRIMESGADLVATGNIGCLMQLKSHLKQRSSDVPVRHIMQLLRDAYQGRPLG
ncbi:MAG: glycolate oxidase subunit GlcF [Planctomycetota bacterium]